MDEFFAFYNQVKCCGETGKLVPTVRYETMFMCCPRCGGSYGRVFSKVDIELEQYELSKGFGT